MSELSVYTGQVRGALGGLCVAVRSMSPLHVVSDQSTEPSGRINPWLAMAGCASDAWIEGTRTAM